MKALILAGGFGTRLGDITREIPKPMVSIVGKPFLEHQINFLKENGVTEVILAVHYMADKIKSYFGNGMRWGITITYSEEEFPLGTAGAIKNAEKYIGETFIVLNGDSYSHIDLKKLIDFHKEGGSLGTIGITKVKDTSQSGKVSISNNKIIEFNEKSSIGEGLINSGIYIFEPKIFDYIEQNKNVSLEKDILPKLIKEELLCGYLYEDYFMDIGKPETYKQFKKDVLNTLCLKENNSVKDALEKISKSEINILLVVDDNKKLLGVLTDRIIKRFLLSGGEINDKITKAMVFHPITATANDSEERLEELISGGINSLPIIDNEGKIFDIKFKSDNFSKENYPILRGKAPLRISFAGGGTDLPYFFDKYGGAVINATIDKYCHATIVKRADKKIIIDSDITKEKDIIVSSIDNLKYGGKFDLIKAIIKIINPDFGFELYLYNDVPPGRGLGSSASLAVLVISLINSLQGIRCSDYQIAEIAYKAEREELKIKGGWQDQYAAVTGGFSFMEFNSDKNIVYPLRLKEDIIYELNSHLLLSYVGKDHSSGDVHKNQEKSFIENEQEIVDILKDIKNKAIEIRDALLTNNLSKIGPLLHESWLNKRKLDRGISNPRIDEIYEWSNRRKTFRCWKWGVSIIFS